MQLKPVHLIVCASVLIATTACSGSIQTDKSIKEERSSSAESGPVVAKAMVRMNDGTPLRKRTFHLVTISRDDKGSMNQVEQLFSVTSDTDENGNLSFPVPRDKISGVKEFSFGLNSSSPYGPPLIIRRKDAKDFLSFKADEKTKTIELGEVIVPLG